MELTYLQSVGLPVVLVNSVSSPNGVTHHEQSKAQSHANVFQPIRNSEKETAVVLKTEPARAAEQMWTVETSEFIDAANTPPCPNSVKVVMQQMITKAARLGLHSAKFLSVEPGYYDQSLEWRCTRLKAGSVDELCKSVVLENTRINPGDSPLRVQCILVIIQYIAKLNKDKLTALTREIEVKRGLPGLGKKQYNLRLLDGDACAKLTGFEHNAVTPVGLELPVVISDKILELPSGSFWMGGGHIDLKLNLSTQDATGPLGAVIADVTG